MKTIRILAQTYKAHVRFPAAFLEQGRAAGPNERARISRLAAAVHAATT
jgi:hypothetical protein